MAERGGFEPPVPCGTTAFEAAPINQTLASLHKLSLLVKADTIGHQLYQGYIFEIFLLYEVITLFATIYCYVLRFVKQMADAAATNSNRL